MDTKHKIIKGLTYVGFLLCVGAVYIISRTPTVYNIALGCLFFTFLSAVTILFNKEYIDRVDDTTEIILEIIWAMAGMDDIITEEESG